MSPLDHLCEVGFFTRWETFDEALPNRCFYYSKAWREGYDSLAGEAVRNGLALERSEKGRVAGLVNQFVQGVPLSLLSRKPGYGMSPVAKRLDPPDHAVVEFRTGELGDVSLGVRSFGFFRAPNVFYAMALIRKKPRKRGEPDPYGPAKELIGKMVARVPQDVDTKTDVEYLITP